MLTIIISSIFQEEPQSFNEGLTLVGVCETIEESKEIILNHFKEEFGDDEYELDWELFGDGENVPVLIKEDFGDNDMFELGYVVL